MWDSREYIWVVVIQVGNHTIRVHVPIIGLLKGLLKGIYIHWP